MANEYTTGQVMGITRTSPATLYRYTQAFPEFFSEQARRPRRGKRWTAQDVNLIYTIRQLYFSRFSRRAIREIITQNPAQLPAPIALEQMGELAGKAMQISEQSSQNLKRAQSLASIAEQRSQNVLLKLDRIQSEQKKLHQEMTNIQREMLKIKWMIEQPGKPPSPKRRRANSVWQEFRQWVFTQWQEERQRIADQEYEECKSIKPTGSMRFGFSCLVSVLGSSLEAYFPAS